MSANTAIRDPIYKFIEVDHEICEHIIDSDFFQRLRWVNQLPLEQLVYPSAIHSRFEHSLGTMFLAEFAARALIANEDSKLRGILKKEGLKEGEFIKGATIAGLLHDIGHAPFSHTFEDATRYRRSGSAYDHEKLGHCIAEKLIGTRQDSAYKLALQALNKKLKDGGNACVRPSISALIIRRLLDGHIDVDKGDYLLRDAYHCGVEYGIYSWYRLWNNVTLARDLRLCVLEKGAEEAWTLLLNRFKMHRTVYRHHVRVVTDAMLIKLIRGPLDDEDHAGGIFPEIGDNRFSNSRSEFFFKSWNDGSFLRGLSEYYERKGDQHLIERFLKRSLYKRTYDSSETNGVFLPEEWLEAEKDLHVQRRIRDVLDKLESNLQESGIEALVVLERPITPPIFDKVQTSQGVNVKTRSGREIPLAEFLGFGIKMLQDTEEIPEEENHGMDRIDAHGLFIKKQTPKLMIFTSSKAYASSIQPEKIDSFIRREWNGGS